MNTLKPKRKNRPTKTVKKWYISGYDMFLSSSKEITVENSKRIKHEKEVIKDRNKLNARSREQINSLLLINFSHFNGLYQDTKELNPNLSKTEVVEITAKRLFGIKLDTETKKLKFILTTVKENNITMDFTEYTVAAAYKYLKAFTDGEISKSSLKSLTKAKQALKIFQDEQKRKKKEEEINEAIQKRKNQGLL